MQGDEGRLKVGVGRRVGDGVVGVSAALLVVAVVVLPSSTASEIANKEGRTGCEVVEKGQKVGSSSQSA